jgi:hypothetical protein
MKVVITGGHGYRLTPGDYWFLENTAKRIRLTEIYTDGRRGVAAQIEDWARPRGIPVHRVRADFVAEGNAPFPRRNNMLTHLADAVIAFPGSATATTDLIAKARVRKLPVYQSPSLQLLDAGLIQRGARQQPPRQSIRPQP